MTEIRPITSSGRAAPGQWASLRWLASNATNPSVSTTLPPSRSVLSIPRATATAPVEALTPTKRIPPAFFDGAANELVDREALFARLSAQDIVLVGEQHDVGRHHQVQLEVLRGLVQRGLRPAVAMEQLPYSSNDTIEEYLAGDMTDAEFRTHWEKHWGWYELYAPILAYAKAEGLPVRGVNVERRIISAIAKRGLAGLTRDERAMLPEEITPIKDPKYLAYVREALSGHGPLPPDVEARLIEAQGAWNEVMGEQTLHARDVSSGPVVVIAGMGHMFYGAGIAESTARRADVDQAVVLPFPLDNSAQGRNELLEALAKDAGTRELGSYFWVTPQAGQGATSPGSTFP